MKINKTLMIFLLLIVTSIFCVAPVFIQLNISEDPLKIILSFIGAIPMYYILSQFFHTLLLWITMILFRLKSIYCYFVVLVRLGSKFYFRIFLNHVMGFAPAIAFQYKEGKLPQCHCLLCALNTKTIPVLSLIARTGIVSLIG
ncbi:MAG: hypothetical protein SPF57_06615 [Streptococcus orisratti]|uniref:hypothetical protein n=2 Tax=Streptococcus TaxID=1301 RepID=UPI002A91AB9B|nr:hypothetical protein [Streptococcus orisratti]MDY5635996.1 hypothetical protein [Streptococcus orisratti]